MGRRVDSALMETGNQGGRAVAQRGRRGRPLGLPTPPTSGRAPEAEALVAWLLVTHRLHHPDADAARRTELIERIRAAGQAVDMSRLSRWESGRETVPTTVIRAYEGLLDLPDWSLVAIASSLRAAFGGGATTLPHPEGTFGVHAELDEIFEAISQGRATGADWFLLAGRLTSHEQIYLRPESWAELSGLLVSETPRSHGHAYLRRHEAMRMFVHHPLSHGPTLDAIDDFTRSCTPQVIHLPLTLLEDDDSRRATDLVLGLVMSDDPSLRMAAAWTAATKAVRGHLGPDGLIRLEAHTAKLLGRLDGALTDVAPIDMACRLPDENFARLHAHLRHPGVRRFLEQARTTGHLVPAESWRPIVKEMAAHVRNRVTPTQAHEPDAMLEALLRDAIFNVHKQRRHQAALALGVSAYRDALAGVSLEMAAQSSPVVADRMLTVNLYTGLGDAADRALRIATDSQSPSRRRRALTAIALSGQPLPADHVTALRALLGDAHPDQVRRGALHALGMHGADLSSLPGRLPVPLQREAEWWAAAGAAVVDRDQVSRSTVPLGIGWGP